MRRKLAMVGVTVALGALLVGPGWPGSPSPSADKLYKRTLARIQAVNQLGADRNGFRVLEPLWRGTTLQAPDPIPLAAHWRGCHGTLAAIRANPKAFARVPWR